MQRKQEKVQEEGGEKKREIMRVLRSGPQHHTALQGEETEAALEPPPRCPSPSCPALGCTKTNFGELREHSGQTEICLTQEAMGPQVQGTTPSTPAWGSPRVGSHHPLYKAMPSGILDRQHLRNAAHVWVLPAKQWGHIRAPLLPT